MQTAPTSLGKDYIMATRMAALQTFPAFDLLAGNRLAISITNATRKKTMLLHYVVMAKKSTKYLRPWRHKKLMKLKVYLEKQKRR